MVKLNRSPEYHENTKRFQCGERQMPCAICGRPIKNIQKAVMIHLHQGGGTVVTEQEAEELNRTWPGADLGCYPIGSDCFKKHPELKPYGQRPQED